MPGDAYGWAGLVALLLFAGWRITRYIRAHEKLKAHKHTMEARSQASQAIVDTWRKLDELRKQNTKKAEEIQKKFDHGDIHGALTDLGVQFNKPSSNGDNIPPA